ncbi:MAG: hypothetical protein CMK32_06685 [Porticoccaceae bacterium]|nr:hypothetical protein [Porticoccaceae bacterium]
MNNKHKHAVKPLAAMVLTSLSLSMNAQAAIDEIIVTAQKREQNLQDVPISVDVLTADAMRVSKIDSTIDLALNVPSLTFQQGFSSLVSTFGMRGFSTFTLDGGIQPSVSFVIDGVPISRVGEFAAELGDVERVEILRGPQGTLFGRNATAGAINIVRKKPTETLEGYVEASVTDDDEVITRFSVSGPLTEGVSGLVAGYGKQLDGYIDNLYPGSKDNGSEDNWGVLGKLQFNPSDDLEILLTGDLRRQDTTNSPSATLIPEQGDLAFVGFLRTQALGNGDFAKGQQVLNDPYTINANYDNYSDTENWGVSADISWNINANLSLKSITAYRDFRIATAFDVDATPATILDPMGLPVVHFERTNYSPNSRHDHNVIFDTDYFSQEFRLEYVDDRVQWINGFYFQDYNDQSSNETPLAFVDYFFEPGAGLPGDGVLGNNYYFDAPEVEAEATWTNWALFSDLTFRLTDSVELFGGLRWTQEDVDFDYSRRNIIGPAEAPFFNPQSADFVNLDLDALLADPLWSLFQGVTEFSVTDRSEDWSGRIGVSWDATADVNFYVSASRGFIGSGISFGRVANLDNAIIDPSIAEAYELGMKSSWFDNTLRVNGALFWQEVEDLQTTNQIPGTVNVETLNAGTITSQGLELDVTWAATDNLTFSGALSYIDAEIDDLIQPCYPGQVAGCTIDNSGDGFPDAQDVAGNRPPNAPELAYNVRARYDMPLSSMPFDTFVQVSYVWQDEVQFKLDSDPLTEMDAYGLMDVVFGIEDKAGKYQITVFGKNVTDEDFYAGLEVAEGVIGRQFARVSRAAQSYYGIKARYNF